MLSSEDFPAPLGPMIAVSSPDLNFPETPFKTVFFSANKRKFESMKTKTLQIISSNSNKFHKIICCTTQRSSKPENCFFNEQMCIEVSRGKIHSEINVNWTMKKFPASAKRNIFPSEWRQQTFILFLIFAGFNKCFRDIFVSDMFEFEFFRDFLWRCSWVLIRSTDFRRSTLETKQKKI